MVKYTILLVIVVLALLSVSIIYFSKDYYKLLPLGDKNEKAAVDLEKYDFHEWKEFEAPGAKFRVMIPVIPQQATENIQDSTTGKTLNYDMYVSEKLNGTIFMISLITFESVQNKNEAERLLGNMMDDMLKSNPQNTLKSNAYTEYQGHPALDFTIENESANIDVKMFMVENTMYVLTRVAQNFEKDPSEFNFFVNSFQLSKEKPAK